ncbi:MAG: hypothetical protein AAGD06_09250 [Acidobacteriota bacterium]
MRRIRCLSTVIALLLCTLTLPASAAAGDDFTIALMGGTGGSPDSDGFGNTSVQALFAMDLAVRTRFVLRAGQMDLDLEQGDFTRGFDLTYVTASTEYQMPSSFYESGLFIGIGFYDLEPDFGEGENAVGLNLGVTGDFTLTDRWSILAEFSAHWADLDAENFFFLGHVGVAFHF